MPSAVSGSSSRVPRHVANTCAKSRADAGKPHADIGSNIDHQLAGTPDADYPVAAKQSLVDLRIAGDRAGVAESRFRPGVRTSELQSNDGHATLLRRLKRFNEAR